MRKIRLPRTRKRSRDTQSRTKKYANPVFDDWKKSVAEEIAVRETTSLVIGKCLLCFALLCVLLASFVVTERMQISGKRDTEAVLGEINRVLNEHGNVIRELETYERYADMRMKVPLYLQFAVIAASSKMGVFWDSVSFEQVSGLGSLKESFVVETGRNTDSVKILGQWKVKGFLLREADNRWALSFKDAVEGMFSLMGSKSFVSAALRGTDLEATVILYE